ncbi:MAG: hypothetical protein M9936_21760 [Caldilinea sp.]|nr:hypothetical protein [Caldilinea sp.]
MHPPQQTATTTLQQPWLNIARALWIILSTTAVVALIASTVRGWGAPLPACTAPGAVCGPWAVSQEDMALAAQAGLPMPAMMAFYYASSLLPKMFFILVGVFIFWRRSDNWVALLLSLMLTLWAVEGVENLGAAMPLVTMLYAIPTGIFILLPFVFPDGRFVPRWTLWVAWPLAAISIVATILPQLGLPLNDRVYAGALLSPFSLWFGLAGYAVVYRYRRISNRMEQQQTKWVMASILGTFLGFIPMAISAVLFPPSEPSLRRFAFMFLVYIPIYILTYLFLSGGIAFAILRYRLYDVDVIIRKTLIYALLTALLALVFFGSIVLLQRIFEAITGQRSQLSIVLSTLAIAALARPLHTRIQGWIDRRFYRKKYDAQQVLAQFAITARDETDMNALTKELARVVQETMEPEGVNVWLRK